MIAFGPIPSRRLGKSLGINNIASKKACSYGCVYCQVGDTLKKNINRQSFYEPAVLIESVYNHLKKLDPGHKPDYLTFVANGEPTLDINLGKEIQGLKQFGIPVAVITNASLIYLEEVRENLMYADWVSVKVDSADENAWKRINRPQENLDLAKIFDGIRAFSSKYKGKLNTETMLVANYNDSPGQIADTAAFIASIKPETAFLSLPIRPPAVKGIKPVDEGKLAMAWQVYKDAGINTELLAGFEGTDTGYTGNAYEDILNIASVHPIREDTMSVLLRKENTSDSVVHSLISQGLIKSVKHNGLAYFVRSYKV
ncbi:MAG: radical SAM protein [Bacteroidales bacterium]|nr:radical SAM protein [Bacteroidales bacterium]